MLFNMVFIKMCIKQHSQYNLLFVCLACSLKMSENESNMKMSEVLFEKHMYGHERKK